nr:sulfatase-like hydrolase/transferase [Saprospiraceae bacterium]
LPFPFLEFVRDNVVNGAADNSPLKGGKNTTYEGGIRVPAFIYAPKWLPQQKVDQRITVNDVLPTLAGAVHFNSFDHAEADGINQWPFLQQETQAPSKDFVAVSRFNQAYFRDHWKLLLPNDRPAELYKVMEDPNETKDLALEHPTVVSDLKAALLGFPRGETVDDPLWKVFVDPDLFGGKEDREPFAGVEGKIAGPLHPTLYLFPLIILAFLTLITGVTVKLIRRLRTTSSNS